MKKCSKCGELKKLSSYAQNGQGGLRGDCKDCHNAMNKRRRNTVEGRAYQMAIQMFKRLRDTDISKNRCYKGIENRLGESPKEVQAVLLEHFKDDIERLIQEGETPSLDRIDSQGHYELGNINLELRAWFYAVEFCRELGFTRWDVFFQYAKNCLSTYFSDLPYSHRLDRRFGFKGTSPTFEEGLEHLRNVIGVPFEEFKEEDITKEEKSIRDELFELLGW